MNRYQRIQVWLISGLAVFLAAGVIAVEVVSFLHVEAVWLKALLVLGGIVFLLDIFFSWVKDFNQIQRSP